MYVLPRELVLLFYFLSISHYTRGIKTDDEHRCDTSDDFLV